MSTRLEGGGEVVRALVVGDIDTEPLTFKIRLQSDGITNIDNTCWDVSSVKILG